MRHSMGPPGLSPASQDVVLQPRGLDRIKQPSVSGHKPDCFSGFGSRVAHSLRGLASHPGGVSELGGGGTGRVSPGTFPSNSKDSKEMEGNHSF